MARFFERGGVWVLGQSVLLGAVVLLGVFFGGSRFPAAVVLLGAVLMAVGAGVALVGALGLGRNLTPFPKPAEQARLVQNGIYSLIRHPLYTSVISVSIAWALLWQSWLALLVALALIPFFHSKARHEERWLRERFPEYADYARRVRRFIPWLY
ncbi:MAG: isoprenylcysteine carboxylmethyltransferase family protein [Verrucomicrobiota bacterium]